MPPCIGIPSTASASKDSHPVQEAKQYGMNLLRTTKQKVSQAAPFARLLLNYSLGAKSCSHLDYLILQLLESLIQVASQIFSRFFDLI